MYSQGHTGLCHDRGVFYSLSLGRYQGLQKGSKSKDFGIAKLLPEIMQVRNGRDDFASRYKQAGFSCWQELSPSSTAQTPVPAPKKQRLHSGLLPHGSHSCHHIGGLQKSHRCTKKTYFMRVLDSSASQAAEQERA